MILIKNVPNITCSCSKEEISNHFKDLSSKFFTKKSLSIKTSLLMIMSDDSFKKLVFDVYLSQIYFH